MPITLDTDSKARNEEKEKLVAIIFASSITAGILSSFENSLNEDKAPWVDDILLHLLSDNTNFVFYLTFA